MNEAADNALRNGKVGKLLFKYSFPCVLSLLVTAVYNLVDQLFIGNEPSLGVIGNSATTVIFPLTILGLALSLLLGDGMCAFLSQCRGRRDTGDAQKAIASTLLIGIGVCFVYTAICVIFMPQIVNLLGATDENREMAILYGYIICGGISLQMIYNAINPLIRGDGSPVFAMIAQVSGAVINIILDPIFLFVFHWGIAGAAIATLIGQAVSAILSLFYLFRTKSFKLHLADFGKGWKFVGKTLSLGISSFFIQLSLVVVTVVSNVVLSSFATVNPSVVEAEAVFGIVYKVFTIVVNIAVGIALGGEPIIAYNYGAKQYKRCIKIYNYVLISSAVFMVIAMIIFQLWPDPIISLFGSDVSSSYISFAERMFRIYLLAILLTGTQRTCSVFYQSIGKPVQGTIMSLARDFIFLVPLTFILCYAGMGLDGFLWAAPIADIIAFIVSAICLIFEYKRLLKLDAVETNRLEKQNQEMEEKAA